MIVTWVFAFITLAAVLLATFVSDLRRAALALWVAGLGVGGVYLTIGAELLGVVQWIVSTLVAISFVFFTAMFGEAGIGDPRPLRRRAIGWGLGLALGLAFAAIIWLGTQGFPEIDLAVPRAGNDLLAVGRTMADEHILSLEVLALTLFLVLIGGGAVARPEDDERGET